ncbi:DUF2726 domain-containing protein [Yersinia pestis]|nr:DUF2726 domain-containing protein [Yersinia pestis]MDL1707466.1 DUF2726 domain-containing protein [Yersinia pestis]MDL1723437.1 DUF2726 domain-containing protein [Yersinia pestis]MDL1727483.1 DUF2726 domain-containing protein [Yersinia pestis]MDL1838495.1 DUF2726 domain-containing protein [Yersinia pestis]
MFKRNKQKVIESTDNVILPSSVNVFSDFISNNPQHSSNAFIAIGEVDCFKKIPLLSDSEAEFLGVISRNIIPDYSVYPKVRLIEFVRPYGNDDAVKNLIIEVQNITCDFVVTSFDGGVLAVVQFGDAATVRQQKKRLVIKRVCEMTGISYYVFKNTLEMMSDESFAVLLKDDE